MSLPGTSYVEFMRRTYGHLYDRIEECEVSGVVVASRVQAVEFEEESTCLDCGAPHPHFCPRSDEVDT